MGREFVGRPRSGRGDYLLAAYGGAKAAFSLRQLNTSYPGSCVEVRESGGGTYADIGFVNGVLDETALLAHCGANDGFVRTWYDQSGNGDDASQGTAASQPQIVSSGSVITENGKPALDFDGGDDELTTAAGTIFYTPEISFFGVITQATLSGIGVFFCAGKNASQEARSIFATATTGGITLGVTGDNTGTDFPAITATQQHLVAVIGTGLETGGTDVTNGWVDGVKGTEHTALDSIKTPTGTEAAVLGRNFGGTAEPTKIQEILAYNSDQSSVRSGVEANINKFYGIY